MGSPPALLSGSRRSRRQEGEAVGQYLRRLASEVKATGLAAAGALHAMVDRLEQFEERLGNLEPIPETTGAVVPPEETESLTVWWARLADPLSRGERVLYAQSRVDEVVAELRAAGFDAYGITSTGPQHRPGPDVRSGAVLTHLGAVPDGALGAVVLAGLPEVMSPHTIGPLVSELGRVAKTVALISEAPWWWRLRLGAVNADLAVGRPLDPDTWLHAFHGVAMIGSAEYDPTGQTYRVVARARE
jgi:hypothetical protein